MRARFPAPHPAGEAEGSFAAPPPSSPPIPSLSTRKPLLPHFTRPTCPLLSARCVSADRLLPERPR